jgi:hypothetical protein
MRKTFLLLAMGLAASTGMKAQTLPEGMEMLTPEGVTVTTMTDRSFDKSKNIVISGSAQAGWKVFFTAK